MLLFFLDTIQPYILVLEFKESRNMLMKNLLMPKAMELYWAIKRAIGKKLLRVKPL